MTNEFLSFLSYWVYCKAGYNFLTKIENNAKISKTKVLKSHPELYSLLHSIYSRVAKPEFIKKFQQGELKTNDLELILVTNQCLEFLNSAVFTFNPNFKNPSFLIN